MKDRLTPAQFRQLVRLNARLSRILNLDAQPKRDAITGAFTNSGTLTGKAVRAAWQLTGVRPDPNRNAFKTQLLASLRTQARAK